MKRIFALVFAFVLAATFVGGLAESIDLSAYDDEALSELYSQVQRELENRNTEEPASEEEKEPILMQKGSRGNDVKALQEKLISLGYLSGGADGDFGNKTTNAIMAFQRANGLQEDGLVTQSLMDMIEQSVATMPAKPRSYSAVELYNTFERNRLAAEEALKGETLIVSGKVYSIDSSMWGDYFVKLYADSWGLMGVYCYFDDEMKDQLSQLSKDKKVSIKGECSGVSIFGEPELKGCEVIG